MENIQQEKHFDPQTLPIPDILPILPVHGFVFFPGMGFPLQISSESAKQLVDESNPQQVTNAVVSSTVEETGNC